MDKREMQMENQLEELTQIPSWIHMNIRLSLQMDQEIYMANLIAENMYSQVDEEGQQYTLMSEIIDHKSDGKALSKDDGFYLDRYGKQQPRMTTCG